MHNWLSRAVFDWAPNSPGAATLGDTERVRRPHAILAHAENVLSKSESEFSVADSILGLKRAINSRLQHLDEIYEFRELFPKQVGSLERLEQVGLARPFLIKQLFELRNNIEHSDASPPSAERARELVDAAWYFLRSTDSACKWVLNGVILRPLEESSCRDPELWLEIEVLPGQRERFRIWGWISLDLISETEQPGFLLLEVATLRSKRLRQANSLSNIGSWSHAARRDDERWIVAQADVPQDLRKQIWRLAFETL